ncbi:MAG: nicotinamide mononucleotide deamidase-related protein [Pyrobaculum sp.]
MHKGVAWILSIGNELLIGRVVNTNAAWLASKLTFLGYAVRRILVVPDEEGDIVEAFREAVDRADVVISTGGLGPTPDDITNLAFCKAVGAEPVVNEEALRMVREKYEARGYPLTQERIKMAMMPPGAKPLPNPVGTAPGILYEIGGKVVVILPGVPREMEAIFESHVEPLLRGRGPPVYFSERVVVVRGVPEADAAPLIREVMRIDPRVYVKSHPKGFEVDAPLLHIHIYASAGSREEAEALVERAAGRLVELIKSRHGERAAVSTG